MSKNFIFITRTIGRENDDLKNFRFNTRDSTLSYCINPDILTPLSNEISVLLSYPFIKERLLSEGIISDCNVLCNNITSETELLSISEPLKIVFCSAILLEKGKIENDKKRRNWNETNFDEKIKEVVKNYCIEHEGASANCCADKYIDMLLKSHSRLREYPIYKINDTPSGNVFFAIEDNDKGYGYGNTDKVRDEFYAIIDAIGATRNEVFFFIHASTYEAFLKKLNGMDDFSNKNVAGFHHVPDSKVWQFLSNSYKYEQLEQYAEFIFEIKNIFDAIEEQDYDFLKDTEQCKKLVSIIERNFKDEYASLLNVLKSDESEHKVDMLIDHNDDLVNLKHDYKNLL